jgi:predicted metal-dependent hydrolase
MTDMPIEIVRSQRRKKTAQAYVVDDRVRVLVPAGLTPEDEARIVEGLVDQVSKKLEAPVVDLASRARVVARKYRLPEPRSIEWSTRQNVRWGSCTPAKKSIRISHRLQGAPLWVLDWVLVHELAHLEVAGHGPEFKEIIARYPLGERAEGYLIAKSEG